MSPEELHQIQDSFSLGHWSTIALPALVIVGGIVLLALGRFPGVTNIRLVVNMLDSRGGNILIYFGLTLFFFSSAMRTFYHALAMIAAKQLDEKSAVLMMAIQFVSASAFGGAFSALLKTSTGTDNARSGDRSALPANGPPANGAAAPPVQTSAPPAGWPVPKGGLGAGG